MKKILHITESLGGGVATALQGYVRSAPQHEHYLLASTRAGTHDDMPWTREFKLCLDLQRSLIPGISAVRKAYARIRPDWLHLHSSFGGAYGRMALLPRHKIIYTPHCYASERQDISTPHRAAFRLAEHILSAGGAITAGVSPREVDLARSLTFSQQATLLPNAAVIPEAIFEARKAHRRNGRLRVAMAGRVTFQKDPQFFADTVRAARAQDMPIDFIWLGGGDVGRTQTLLDAGVEVSGWLSHSEILTRLAACDVYYHTASWEAAPMSILEAAQLGLTLVCRDTPSVASLPVTPLIDTPENAARVLGDLTAGLGWERFAPINIVLNEKYSIEAQRNALANLYAGTV